MAPKKKIKVLIVENDSPSGRKIHALLEDNGFDCRLAFNIRQATVKMLEWHPRVVITDLILPDGNGILLKKTIDTEPALKNDFISFILMSSHNQQENVHFAIRNGIDDYLVKPFKNEDLLARVVFLCRAHRILKTLDKNEISEMKDSSLLLYLTDLVLQQALKGDSIESTLFNLTCMITMKTDGVRCNIIQVLEDEVGIVVTSNDDRSAAGIRLDLNKYPEVLHVRNIGHTIAVDDIGRDKNLKFIHDNVRNINFNSIVVCPLYHNQAFFGVLSLKIPSGRPPVSENELRFIEICSHVVSLTLQKYFAGIVEGSWQKPAA